MVMVKGMMAETPNKIVTSHTEHNGNAMIAKTSNKMITSHPEHNGNGERHDGEDTK